MRHSRIANSGVLSVATQVIFEQFCGVSARCGKFNLLENRGKRIKERKSS
jgi:hypothetical protein